jgi:hypothetical protein
MRMHGYAMMRVGKDCDTVSSDPFHPCLSLAACVDRDDSLSLGGEHTRSPVCVHACVCMHACTWVCVCVVNDEKSGKN